MNECSTFDNLSSINKFHHQKIKAKLVFSFLDTMPEKLKFILKTLWQAVECYLNTK